MGEVTKAIDGAKGAIDKVKELAGKAKGFFEGLDKDKWLLYGGIALGVIVLLFIIGAVMKSGRRRRNAFYGTVRANGRAERRALRRAEKREDRYYRALIRQKRRENYYKPRKRRVFYVKTKAPKARRQAKVQRVYAAADQSTMMATGIVGMGIGAMAYRTLVEEKRRIRF